MRTDLLDYELPDELVATRPLAERDAARLLVVGPSGLSHRRVRELADLVPEGALLVVNDTRVRRARVHGTRESGGKVELLMLGRLEAEGAESGFEVWQALGRSSKPLRPGTLVSAGRLSCEVLTRAADATLTVAVRSPVPVEDVLAEEGHVPIPPYLRRGDDADDVVRYQTVYARRTGSVAAPTAGLHLTEELFERLRARGVRVGRLELEIGLGTFRPVVAETLAEHVMHEESFTVDQTLSDEVKAARVRGAKVVAVGTTCVRALEASADPERPGLVVPQSKRTRLLIAPGYSWQVVDALLTNFHQPRSTLLALVAAFVGLEALQGAYQEALRERYRFLSFGDAMWLPERAP